MSHASPVWTTGTTEVYHTGTWRNQVPKYINPPSPCHSACPVDGNIALWIQQIKEQDYYGAWVTLTENNPFPCIAGRICHHPCEPACNRGLYDEPIAICGLERFVGDLALEQDWKFPEVPVSRQEKIAIIGGGPAGLAAAFHLRRLGYPVTIFEAQPELGGLLRYGIPPYRLSNEILDRETQRILDLGIEVHTGTPVRTKEAYEKLKKEFEVLYLAMGAAAPKRLPALDYDQEYVMDGARYLELTNSGNVPELGRRVIVIGGGSAAMDAARTARRHGRDITIMALEPRDNMPCQWEEVLEAEEENIRLINGAMVQSVESSAGGLILNCIEVEFIPGKKRGQFTLQEKPGTEFTLEADNIVTSIGQDPDMTVLGDMLQTDGALIKTDKQYQTSEQGVFAGGDVASMERFVTAAFGMGKQAAGEIHRYLHPDTPVEDSTPINRYLRIREADNPKGASHDVDVEVINKYYYGNLPRERQGIVAAAERLKSFNETQLNFSVDKALHESGRCFSCGNCIFCDNCLYYCPDMAITRIEHGYAVNSDFCKGCGLCVNECPTGSIAMFEDN